MLRKFIGIIFGCCWCIAALAASDSYHFATPEQQERFNNLTQELRCLVCQNQNLADSNAPLAIDLRNEIAKQFQQGWNEEQITHYLTNRYGEFIRYKPAFNKDTFVLWFSPFFLLLGSIGLIVYITLSKKRKQVLQLSQSEQQRLAQLLKSSNRDNLA